LLSVSRLAGFPAGKSQEKRKRYQCDDFGFHLEKMGYLDLRIMG
jgi:hypothetical protein